MINKEYIFPEKKRWIPRSAHQGAALLIFLIILVLGMSSLLLSQLNERTAFVLEEQAQTTKALVQAKEALLGYAASYYETEYPNRLGEYGFLPCPDQGAGGINGEGQEGGNCEGRNENSLGRLPWKSLGIPPLRDGTGECLWYAVSGPYKNGSTTKTFMLNEDTNGSFEVSTDPNYVLGSTLPKDRIVAVIIAPGRILAGQQRNTEIGAELCGGNYAASNYLDQDNASLSLTGTSKFVFSQGVNGDPSINDRIVSITREELWQFIQKRKEFKINGDLSGNLKCLTEIVAACVGNYGREVPTAANKIHYLPWPAPIDLNDYNDKASYTECPNYPDCPNYQGNASKNVLLGRLPNDASYSKSQVPGLSITAIIDECNFTTVDSSKLVGCQDLLNIKGKDCVGNPNLPECVTFRHLWQNWKDHLFYAVAKIHLSNGGVSPYVSCNKTDPDPLLRCKPDPCSNNNCCEDLCVRNGTTEFYPAAVIFAGERMELQKDPKIRNASPPLGELDTKNIAWNYLSNQNWGNNAFTLIHRDNFTLLPLESTTADNGDKNDIISWVNW